MANRVREPEVFKAGEPLPMRRRDPFIEQIAHVMDGLIPIGRWRIGLDSIVGLIPGIGDVIGAAVGMLIVLRAVQAGIPRVAIARMMTNIAIDTVIGAIPFLGDAFDFVFKSNSKNLRIYEEALQGRRGANARHWWFFAALFAGVGIAVWLVAMAVMAVARDFRLF
jgi:hypothetical protein